MFVPPIGSNKGTRGRKGKGGTDQSELSFLGSVFVLILFPVEPTASRMFIIIKFTLMGDSNGKQGASRKYTSPPSSPPKHPAQL